MKNRYLLLFLGIFSGVSSSIAQRSENFARDFEPVKAELTSWDRVRGEWLANSILAVADESAIPDRNFPEDLTPYQMMNVVPTAILDRVNKMIRNNATNTQNPDAPYWDQISDVTTRPGCTPVKGRSYGDPHLQSFDGARYSFQTVGEFVLAKSNDGELEIQGRQKARQDDFSLNTAVAMNVGGDRVCVYSEDAPDNDNTTPIRVNGQPVHLNGDTYFLSHGGTVRFENNNYIIDWPTGESVTANITGGNSMRFMNLSFSVFPCTRNGYTGLMGNANGIERDDFNSTRGAAPIRMAGAGVGGAANQGSEYMEKQRLAWLAKEFAEDHRITQAASLFDYPIGTSTFTFTDRSFPKVHHTLDDLDDDRRTTARRNCENDGITGADLDGCIYDNGFLGLPPSRTPIVSDPSQGISLVDVDGRTPNTNTSPAPNPIKKKTGGTIYDNQPGADPINEAKPVKKDPGGGQLDNSTPKPVKEPVKTPETNDQKPPININIGKPNSGGGGSTPKPTTPKPTTPKPTTVIKGKGL